MAYPIGWQRTLYIGLGESQPTVPEQKMPSLGPHRRMLVDGNTEGVVLVLAAVCIRRVVERQPLNWSQSLAHQGNVCDTAGHPAGDKSERRGNRHTRTRRKTPFPLLCPSSTLC